MITLLDLERICPTTKQVTIEVYVEPLNEAMKEFDIDQNPAREAMFLAQIAHESSGFKYVRELASGKAYEGRQDLGNVVVGDGERYRGRGLIQITGRANYRSCGNDLGVDVESEPELLERPDLACRSAAWFWNSRNLNTIADRGDFLTVTKKINGGTTGYASRLRYLASANRVIGDQA